jgi:hypothetical protein
MVCGAWSYAEVGMPHGMYRRVLRGRWCRTWYAEHGLTCKRVRRMACSDPSYAEDGVVHGMQGMVLRVRG